MIIVGTGNSSLAFCPKWLSSKKKNITCISLFNKLLLSDPIIMPELLLLNNAIHPGLISLRGVSLGNQRLEPLHNVFSFFSFKRKNEDHVILFSKYWNSIDKLLSKKKRNLALILCPLDFYGLLAIVKKD